MGFLDRLKEMFGGGGSTSSGPQVDAGTQEATTADEPAMPSTATEQTPEEQTQTAAEDPASSAEPGSEGQDQEPQ